jgi:hypothetical protein
MKPKENKGNKVGTYDDCQTPPYALEPLLPYINPLMMVWECASGKEILSKALTEKGYNVLSTSIEKRLPTPEVLYGDFFQMKPVDRNYTIVTNPPYSIKYTWLERCFELGRPFALLLPIETIGTKKAQEMFKDRDIRIMFLNPRVDFLMSYSLWGGAGAQFPTAWFTWGLPLPKENNYAILNKPKRNDLGDYWRKVLGEDEYFRTINEAEKSNIEYRVENNLEIVDFYEYLRIERNE